jgi:hypothetical protein
MVFTIPWSTYGRYRSLLQRGEAAVERRLVPELCDPRTSLDSIAGSFGKYKGIETACELSILSTSDQVARAVSPTVASAFLISRSRSVSGPLV